MLVHVFVRHDLSLQFGRGVVAVIARRSILARRVIHECIGQDLLNAAALDLACCESVSFDHSWCFTEDGLHLLGRDVAAIQ